MITQRLNGMVLAMLTTLAMVTPVSALAAGSLHRDCDSNALLYCGAASMSEFQTKLDRGDSKHTSAQLHKIYFEEGRGITSTGLQGAVLGTVYKDGRVVVGGKTVATSARTDGRLYMSGSVKDGAFWQRPTQVSFRETSIPAFVGMTGGSFKWAILQSCGNTVTAVAVASPAPTKPKATPKPVPSPSTAPTPTPSPSPAVLAAHTSLPATGGESLTSLIGLGAVWGGATLYIRSRRNLKRSIKQK